MIKKGLKYSFLLLLCTLFSCSKFSRLQKSGSYEEKFAAAEDYFQKKDYYRSGVLYESILPLSPGKKEAETIRINYAYTQFHQKHYEMAAYYFQKYIETYPRSEKAIEAQYMESVSYYKQSPKWNLDQSNTHKAISRMQVFINAYPYSQYKDDCNRMINEMQVKLETKAHNHAKTYYKVGYYRSAVVAAESFRKEFPDSKYNEEIAFMKVSAEYNLAKMSVKDVNKDGKIIHLQATRYQDAQRFYFEFIDKYPNSIYKKEAETLYKNIITALKSL